ncbi:hypothetical protein FRC04_003047 [Tulasnella sp. 424]|nr:hypothetical protein FRC04_003047 [Tulasnella sp. 424]
MEVYSYRVLTPSSVMSCPYISRGWKSFQKQMSNYGLKKRDRNADQAHYVHWDNKFCCGRRDLIPQVVRRPIGKKSTSPSQDTVPEQLFAPNSPGALQPQGRPNLDDEVELLKKQLETKDNEIAELKGRLEVVEAQVLKVPELEKQISSKLDTALDRFWSVLSQMVPKMITDTTNLALRTLPGLQIPNNAASSTLHHSAGISVAQAPPMLQGGLTNDPGSSSVPGLGQQPNAGPSIGTPTSASNDFVSSSTSQAQLRTPNSNSAMASNGPTPTVYRVPQPSAPGSWL